MPTIPPFSAPLPLLLFCTLELWLRKKALPVSESPVCPQRNYIVTQEWKEDRKEKFICCLLPLSCFLLVKVPPIRHWLPISNPGYLPSSQWNHPQTYASLTAQCLTGLGNLDAENSLFLHCLQGPLRLLPSHPGLWEHWAEAAHPLKKEN